MFVSILIAIALAESVYILVGKENLTNLLKNYRENVFGTRDINYEFGMYATEANDFIQHLKGFFQSITLADYKAESGWITITYGINGIRVQDREAIKKAICIELHSYMLNNHRVDFWGYYVPVFTDDTVMLRIAASRAAEREFAKLQFAKKIKKEIPMEEEL